MAYGKYNREPTILTPSSPEAMFTNFQNYGLLGALANELMSNYNARGIKKGTAEAEAALANMTKPKETPESADQKKYMEQNATVDLNQNLGVTPQKDAQTQAIEGQRKNLPSLNANGPDPIAPSEGLTKKYFDMNGNQTADALTPQALQPQARDLAAEKIDYAVEKYKNSDNPAEDKRTITEGISQGKPLIDSVPVSQLPEFDMKEATAQIRAQLKKNGRTDYQIDQIMEGIAPSLIAKEKEWKAAKADELYNSYVKATDSGDLLARTELVANMAKYDPIKATVLSRLVDKDWKNTDMRDQIDQRANMYMELGNMSKEDAYKKVLGLDDGGVIGGYGGTRNYPRTGNSGNGGDGGYGGKVLNTKERNAIYKVMQDLKDKNPGDPATWKDPLAKQQYAECLDALGLGGDGQGGDGGQGGQGGQTAADFLAGVDLDDYYASVAPGGAFMKMFNALVQTQGKQKAQATVEKIAADTYGKDTPYYNEITNNIGVGNAESRAEYKAKQKKDRVERAQPTLHPGTRSGFAKDSSWNKNFNILTGDEKSYQGHVGPIGVLEELFGSR